MKKIAFLLVPAILCVVLSGCADVVADKAEDGNDPLSVILYESDASDSVVQTEKNDVHESLIGLFDNIAEDSPVPKTDTAGETVNEAEEVKEPVLQDESVQAFAYSGSDTVWISATGKKYHAKPDCSGMKNPTAVLAEQAETEGYTPCKRCF